MKNDDSAEDETDNDETSASARIRQLLRANERLQEELALERQQHALLSALSTSLAQQTHQPAYQATGDTLVWFGVGTRKRYLNARGIRLLALQEGMTLQYEGAQPSGTYAVVADELVVSDYLAPEEAEQTLDAVANLLIQAMQPPER